MTASNAADAPSADTNPLVANTFPNAHKAHQALSDAIDALRSSALEKHQSYALDYLNHLDDNVETKAAQAVLKAAEEKHLADNIPLLLGLAHVCYNNALAEKLKLEANEEKEEEKRFMLDILAGTLDIAKHSMMAARVMLGKATVASTLQQVVARVPRKDPVPLALQVRDVYCASIKALSDVHADIVDISSQMYQQCLVAGCSRKNAEALSSLKQHQLELERMPKTLRNAQQTRISMTLCWKRVRLYWEAGGRVEESVEQQLVRDRNKCWQTLRLWENVLMGAAKEVLKANM